MCDDGRQLYVLCRTATGTGCRAQATKVQRVSDNSTRNHTYYCSPATVLAHYSPWLTGPAVCLCSPVNIMYDKRVVRGPTFRPKLDLSATVTAITPQHKPAANTKPAANATTQPNLRQPLLASPPRHLTLLTPHGSHQPATHSTLVQTDDYLEELTDEVYEAEGSTQTEAAYLPSVDTATESVLSLPMFAPKAAGTDAGTAIEALELFDYDTAVLPLLSTLVGKAMEQAEVEVREEEEMARLESQRAAYERGRQLMVAEVSRLEVEEERRVKEKARRFEAERERLVREQHMQEKRRAMELADQARQQLQASERLRQQREAKDPIAEQVTGSFLPWLLERVQQTAAEANNAREAVESMLRAGVETVREAIREKERRDEEERRERARLAEEDRLRREAEEAERLRLAGEKRLAAEKAAAEEASRLAAEEVKETEEGEEEED